MYLGGDMGPLKQKVYRYLAAAEIYDKTYRA